MAATLYYTADMVRDLIEEWHSWPRFETVHGELLVTSAPRLMHQEIVARLLVALREYLSTEKHGHAMASPADISFGEDTLVQPDVFVLALDQARAMDWSAIDHLLLAVEVLSPSSVRADRFTKRRLYQERGVALYWVIDLERRAAEAWTPADAFPRTETRQLEWIPQGASTPFRLSLDDLFRPI